MNLYIRNLSGDTSEEELKEVFEKYGEVVSAVVIKDKFTGESRGFGFVEMKIKTEAEKAIEELDGLELKGRHIFVSEARPKRDKRKGRKGGNRGGGFRKF